MSKKSKTKYTFDQMVDALKLDGWQFYRTGPDWQNIPFSKTVRTVAYVYKKADLGRPDSHRYIRLHLQHENDNWCQRAETCVYNRNIKMLEKSGVFIDPELAAVMRACS